MEYVLQNTADPKDEVNKFLHQNFPHPQCHLTCTQQHVCNHAQC